MKQAFRFSRGYSNPEILAIILLLSFILLFFGWLFSILFHSHPKAYHSSCASNMKQISIALLGYAEDNDDKFPPIVGTIRLGDGKIYEQQWGFTRKVTIPGKDTHVPGLISSFILNNQIFHCGLAEGPETDVQEWLNTGLHYMYNDLAAEHSSADFAQPGYSILIAEADHRLRNVGHAKSINQRGDAARLTAAKNNGTPRLLMGAAVGDASIRHTEGANYGYADGHVRWLKPTAVFFPERNSSSPSHRDAKTGRVLGPDPEGAEKSGRAYQGRLYSATFHLR